MYVYEKNFTPIVYHFVVCKQLLHKTSKSPGQSPLLTVSRLSV